MIFTAEKGLIEAMERIVSLPSRSRGVGSVPLSREASLTSSSSTRRRQASAGEREAIARFRASPPSNSDASDAQSNMYECIDDNCYDQGAALHYAN